MQILPEYLPAGLGFWGAIAIAGLTVGCVGILIEILVLRPVYKAPELFQLVATFGVILVIQDLALMIWGAEDRLGPRAPGLRGVVRIMGEPIPKYDIALLVITPIIALGLWYLMTNTRLGVLVRAATRPRNGQCLGGQPSMALYGGLCLGVCACRPWRSLATAERGR